jgi:hypothetical protein
MFETTNQYFVKIMWIYTELDFTQHLHSEFSMKIRKK